MYLSLTCDFINRSIYSFEKYENTFCLHCGHTQSNHSLLGLNVLGEHQVALCSHEVFIVYCDRILLKMNLLIELLMTLQTECSSLFLFLKLIGGHLLRLLIKLKGI